MTNLTTQGLGRVNSLVYLEDGYVITKYLLDCVGW